MPDTHTIVAGDTLPAIDATLDVDGVAVNLTGASVTFSYRVNGTLITKACTIVSASTGQVSVTLSAQDTASAGVYDARFRVTFSGGATESFPNQNPMKLVVVSSV